MTRRIWPTRVLLATALLGALATTACTSGPNESSPQPTVAATSASPSPAAVTWDPIPALGCPKLIKRPDDKPTDSVSWKDTQVSALGVEVCINKVEPFTIPAGTGPDLDGDSTLITMTMWNPTDQTVGLPGGRYDNAVFLLAMRGDSGVSARWDAGSERFPDELGPDKIVTRRFVNTTNYTSADDRTISWYDLDWWEFTDRDPLPSPTPR